MTTDLKREFANISVDLDCSVCKKNEAAMSRVPVARVIEKLDAYFSTNDLAGAERLLDYWLSEARANGDLSGELSIVNEMLGLTRRINKAEKGFGAIERALELIALTKTERSISAATILLNAATTSRAFGKPEGAVELYERARIIYEQEGLPRDDARYAALYNNYATTLVSLCRFGEALEYYERALRLTDCAPRLLDHAITCVNIAHLYDAWEGIESPKIAELLRRAEAVLNGDMERTPYYAFVCEKCAPSFDYFGYFFFAKELETRAREIYEGT